ncbi:transcription termination factor 1 [Carettochelys insculpta]|uniref:transcription termination factor 1 n=1 Tax=Carettochelys insculpta TaxID=44489 RepID=UPI003EBA1037
MKKKNREHNESLETNRKTCTQSVEVHPPSPLLFEDRTSQDVVVHNKKLKKENKHEKKNFLLDDSCIGGKYKNNNETETDTPKKKKKKKKRKLSDIAQDQNYIFCVPANKENPDKLQEMDSRLESVDYVYVSTSAKKKKRKRNLSEEGDEVNELAGLYAFENGCKSKKKERKRKYSSTSCDTQEARDEVFSSSVLSSHDEGMILGSSTEMSTSAMPKKRHKPHKCGKSFKNDDSDMTKITFVAEENSLNVTDISNVTSASSNDCSEEATASVRKGNQSHSEQVTSKATKNLPESGTSENEDDQDVEFTESENSIKLNNEEFLEASRCSLMDLETAKRELEEFIPHVHTMSEKSILKMSGRDLIRFKNFKKQGICIKFGRFSKKENHQIQKNVEDFLSLTGIENAEKLLFTYRYPEERKAITALKVKYAFSMKIAEGVPRPWKQVYFRARKMFDPNNYKGRYSEDEKEKLKKYYTIHGNNWKKIAELMSRSTHSVAMKYSQIKSQVKSGPWSHEETQKLVQAVEKAIWKKDDAEDTGLLQQAENSNGTLSVEREKLYKNIPWTEIEAKVGTRYWRQCKQKWISVITKKMSSGQKAYRGTKGLEAKINLIKRLYEMKVEDANEVNWAELCEIFGEVPEAYVQIRFYKLKATNVPSWQTKTFPEIIDYLYGKTLPLLEGRIEKSQKPLQSYDGSHSSCKKMVFQVRGIFDNTEDDAEDSD